LLLKNRGKPDPNVRERQQVVTVRVAMEVHRIEPGLRWSFFEKLESLS
jgi:hypothetical protein